MYVYKHIFGGLLTLVFCRCEKVLKFKKTFFPFFLWFLWFSLYNSRFSI